MKSKKTSDVVKRAQKLLDPAVTASHEKWQRVLAERIAYHEQKLREERDLGRQ
jgi:hypothetical protein